MIRSHRLSLSSVLIAALAACQPPAHPSGWTEASHGILSSPNYSVVFNDDAVHEFTITVSNSTYVETMKDLKVKVATGEIGEGDTEDDDKPIWVPVTVQANNPTDADSNYVQNTWWHVGMRYKGNSSLAGAWKSRTCKLSFRFNFDKFDKDYPSIANQRFYGFKKLVFNNNYEDYSLIRDKLTADLFRNGGQPTSHASFAKVWLVIKDDSGSSTLATYYLGLYDVFEDVSDTPGVLTSQFGNGSGNLYKPEGTGADWTSFVQDSFAKKTNDKDNADWTDISNAIAALNASTRTSDPVTWRKNLESYFDVYGFLNYFALNQGMVNWDSYGCKAHNYYVYGDPVSGGRLTWIPWDFNMALEPDTSETSCYPEATYTSSADIDAVTALGTWPLLSYLLSDSTYWSVYMGYLKSVTSSTGALYPDTVSTLATTYHNLVSDAAQAEIDQLDTMGADDYDAGYTNKYCLYFTFLDTISDFDDSLGSTSDGTSDSDAILQHIAYRNSLIQAALADAGY